MSQKTSGRWAAVVMNADGSPGVDATVSASIPAAPLRIAGIILAILGLGIGSTGAILIAAAWGGRNGRTVAPAPATT